MTNTESRQPTQELETRAASGFPVLTIEILLFLGAPLAIVLGAIGHMPALVIAGLCTLVLAAILAGGFFTLAPNMARVLLLFGEYKGTVRDSGFRWANPFLAKKAVSLRAHNLNGE